MARDIKEVRVGDVYPKKGGFKSKGLYWVIVRKSESKRTVQTFSMREDGTIENGTSCGIWVFENTQPIGICPALAVPVKFPLELFVE